jgi:hypothetical protein
VADRRIAPTTKPTAKFTNSLTGGMVMIVVDRTLRTTNLAGSGSRTISQSLSLSAASIALIVSGIGAAMFRLIESSLPLKSGLAILLIFHLPRCSIARFAIRPQTRSAGRV